MPGEHILIVDDEPAIQAALRGVLEDEGYRVTAVGSGADALRLVTDEPPDLTFLDIWMERMDGLETLAEIKRLRPETIVVMISGHGTIETAVKATKLGAYDFIEKPLSSRRRCSPSRGRSSTRGSPARTRRSARASPSTPRSSARARRSAASVSRSPPPPRRPAGC